MADHLCDYTLKITPSKQLKQFIKENLQLKNEDEMTLDVIKKVYSILKKENHDVRLHQLLNGSEIILPTPTVPPRNAELEARIQKLKEKADEDEYIQMTKKVDLVYRSKHALEFRSDVRIMQSHMAAGLNLLITIGACFLFGYVAVDFILPTPPHIATKLLCGLAVGAVGALADIYLLLKHMDMEAK
ncbi:hypothetical protein CHUAL_005693 [Chamberlinius hualienensis]